MKSQFNRRFEIPVGGMWEYSEWKISFNHICSGLGGREPCEHCGWKWREMHVRYHEPKKSDYRFWFEDKWLCPRVVIASNEGGYDTTGVCLDCILKAASGQLRMREVAEEED